MKQQLTLLVLFFIIFSYISSNSNLETESNRLLWKNVASKFLQVPGYKMNSDSETGTNINFISTESEIKNKFNTSTGGSTRSSTPYLKNSDLKIYYENWMSISSPSFKDPIKYPNLPLPDGNFSEIKVDKNNNRINGKFIDVLKGNKIYPPSYKYFWFRLSGKYLYYTTTKSDMNILGSILISKVEKLVLSHIETGLNETDNTANLNEIKIKIIDSEGLTWVTSGTNSEESAKWLCYMQSSLGLETLSKCLELNALNYNGFLRMNNPKISIQQITQPLIIIPQPSRYCNEKWDYKNSGNDWECKCKDGKEQSPIDLPKENVAISSAVRPLFEYVLVDPIATENSKFGLYKTGEKIKIVYNKNALRIYHNNFGKIVTVNGTGFQAQEIVFRTPSEHTVDGKRYDMEMQVIHNARTKGDYGKKAILSFLFKAKPGIYNKFIDKLDFFNLPNPSEKMRDINKSLYIPHALYDSNDADVFFSHNFSFFTYQGSLTEPPCTENTIHYVASKPILLSVTALQLFKEALNMPDQEDNNGNVVISQGVSDSNNRNTQSLNGRSIFHYDSTLYGSPEFVPKKKHFNILNEEIQTKGHYEKREKIFTEYLFVNGNNPSGIPNSYVVSDSEALNQ